LLHSRIGITELLHILRVPYPVVTPVASPGFRLQFPPPFNFTPPITKFLEALISMFLGRYGQWDHDNEAANYGYMRSLASVVASLEKHEGIIINFPRWNIVISQLNPSDGPMLKYHDLPVQEVIRETERERMRRQTSQPSQDSTASQQPALGSQHPHLSLPMAPTRLSMQRSSIPIDAPTFGSSGQATVLPPAKVHFAQNTRSISPPPPGFNNAEQNSADDYEDVGMTSIHSEDESDAESGHEEPGHNQRAVPRKGGQAPLQQNDIDDDGDEDVIATGLPMPMDDVPEAVLQETLAALQRFTVECNQIAQKHSVSPSVPRWVFLNAESLGLNKRCVNSFNAYQQTEMVKRGWHKSYAEGQRLTPGTLQFSQILPYE